MHRHGPLTKTLMVLAVAGCAGTMPRLERAVLPTDGDRARLRVTARDGTRVALIPDKDCVDLTAPGAGLVLAPQDGGPSYRGQSLGIPGTVHHPEASAEVFVKAGVPITLVYEWRDCEETVSFTPAVNGDYEAYLVAESEEELRALKLDTKHRIEGSLCRSGVFAHPDPKNTKVPYTKPKRCR